MKKVYLLALIMLVPFFAGCSLADLAGQDLSDIIAVSEEGETTFNQKNLQQALSALATAELTEAEKEGLLFMLEEEKLAQDVYSFLYDKWDSAVFNNIAESEATHVEAVKNLIDRYALPVSEFLEQQGVFENSELQELYNTLTTEGSLSLEDALKVGAAIEEIDIVDLEKYISQTDKEDLKLVYENLMKGSRNHLRSFARNMERNGFGYNAQYLENDVYGEILDSEIETGSTQGQAQNQGANKSQGQNKGRR